MRRMLRAHTVVRLPGRGPGCSCLMGHRLVQLSNSRQRIDHYKRSCPGRRNHSLRLGQARKVAGNLPAHLRCNLYLLHRSELHVDGGDCHGHSSRAHLRCNSMWEPDPHWRRAHTRKARARSSRPCQYRYEHTRCAPRTRMDSTCSHSMYAYLVHSQHRQCCNLAGRRLADTEDQQYKPLEDRPPMIRFSHRTSCQHDPSGKRKDSYRMRPGQDRTSAFQSLPTCQTVESWLVRTQACTAPELSGHQRKSFSKQGQLASAFTPKTHSWSLLQTVETVHARSAAASTHSLSEIPGVVHRVALIGCRRNCATLIDGRRQQEPPLGEAALNTRTRGISTKAGPDNSHRRRIRRCTTTVMIVLYSGGVRAPEFTTELSLKLGAEA
jgi:hypothetical protein